MLFRKKKKTHKRFGREVNCGERGKCDVCGKEVRMCDYAYLCVECFSKLPRDIKLSHHLLLSYPEARKEFLTRVIKEWKTICGL